jgi:hypothetical protein
MVARSAAAEEEEEEARPNLFAGTCTVECTVH